MGAMPPVLKFLTPFFIQVEVNFFSGFHHILGILCLLHTLLHTPSYMLPASYLPPALGQSAWHPGCGSVTVAGWNVIGPSSKSLSPWIFLRPCKILVLKLTHTLAHRPWALAPILHPAVLN